ncbi:MAG: hypothetical protein II536_04475, partial [Clostridia bacterium]|nr:hypothetical protein [Clostridia bacterium]
MAKTELMESAKNVGAKAEALLERLKALQGDVSASLQLAKKQESILAEKEKAEKKAREERER